MLQSLEKINRIHCEVLTNGAACVSGAVLLAGAVHLAIFLVRISAFVASSPEEIEVRLKRIVALAAIVSISLVFCV